MSGYFVSGQFAGPGQSQPIKLRGGFNSVLWGVFVGTVVLEQSYDNGATWEAVSIDGTGTPNALTAPCNIAWVQPERDVLTRFNCMGFTSGPINYRISGDST